MRVAILVAISWLVLATIVKSQCYYGQDPTLAAKSCADILAVQPKECLGKDGFYWLTDDGVGGDLDYAYCDMTYKGGGWRRVVYFHSNINTSCPGNLVNETLSNNATYCTKVQNMFRFNTDYEYFTWNDDAVVQFSEIRGYVKVRVKGNNTMDGLADNPFNTYENGNLDGIDIMAREIGTQFPDRPFFSYVVAQTWIIPQTSTDRCPENGGTGMTTIMPMYREGIFACDELDRNGPIDSDGFYTQDLFGPDCVQCPTGNPWFEQRYGSNVMPNTVWIRVTNADDHDEQIYLTDVELYIR